MLKSKISGTVQEVVLPDFPDDENTVTTTVTKSRRVSFGTNFVKEFIVGSAVSAQCMSEYEQAFSSSDSSNADSSHSAAEIGIPDLKKFAIPESLKIHKSASTAGQPCEPDSVENRPKPSKFSRTICFSADSPTADMEFTEGCITLAKSILDKKNKEMTVIIQAVPKEPKEEEKPKEDETKYFDSSQFEMSMTKCLKSKENKREEKRFESEKTKIFSKFEDEMSITNCNKIFINNESDSSWVNCKENLMPLDMIMRHLDKDNSDLENDLFNPKKSFNNFLSADPFDFSNDSEKLNLNESMDISTDFHPIVFKEFQKTTLPDDKLNENKIIGSDLSEKIISNESMEISGDCQSDLSEAEVSPLVIEKPNTDGSEEISTDLLTNIHETSQNLVKSDEAIDYARKDKSEGSEKVYPNITMEITTDPPNVNEVMEMSLQSEEKVIEEKLTNLKGSEETNSIEPMEICGDFQPNLAEASRLFFEKPNTDGLEKICMGLQQNIYETSQNSVDEAIDYARKDKSEGSEKVFPDSQGSIHEISQNSIKSDEAIDYARKDKSEGSEKVYPNITMEITTDPPNVNEVMEMSLQSEEKVIEEKLTNLKRNNETNSIESMEICGELRAEQLPEIVNQSSFGEEICNNKSVELSDKPTDLNVSEKLYTFLPQSNENIFPEGEPTHSENLNDKEAMEISLAEAEASVVTEGLLLDEKITSEIQLNDLEKLDSENILEITADNHSKAFETIENPPPTEAVVDNSSEPRMNESIKVSTNTKPNVLEIRQNSLPPDDRIRKSIEFNSSNETDEVPSWNREPSLVDVKVIESLKEQSKEPGCVWSLKDLRYPQAKTSGLLSFNCDLLESATTMNFYLKTSDDDRLDSCSIIKNREINLNEEKHCRLPEYGLVIEFGFQELKKFFDEPRQKVETIRHIPYFLDQINSFLFKMNSYLRQIHSILILYPGSRLKDSIMSFRLYSFPVFFSCVVSIDLKDLFRLSKSSLSFEKDFGTFDENKIREIFQKCLKNENPLCEFVLKSTNYLFDLEKKSGYVSKRRHIRLLPVELKL